MVYLFIGTYFNFFLSPMTFEAIFSQIKSTLLPFSLTSDLLYDFRAPHPHTSVGPNHTLKDSIHKPGTGDVKLWKLPIALFYFLKFPQTVTESESEGHEQPHEGRARAGLVSAQLEMF